MKKKLRLAVAQINCTVGDLEGNAKKIGEYARKAEKLGADIVSFPELAVTGYPPEDLLLKSHFIDDNLAALKNIVKGIGDIVAVVGFVDRKGGDIYNAAAVIYKGKVKGVAHKLFLPNYGVFDEKRYFTQGSEPAVFKFGEFVFGVDICEDIWQKNGPVKLQSLSGARFIININASPYHAGKIKEREEIIRSQAKNGRVAVSYVNLVGGQDELVFDGQSMVVDAAGRIKGRARAFKEDLLAVDIDISTDKVRPPKKTITIAEKVVLKEKPALPESDVKPLEPIAEIYQALVLGLKDYVHKNGFQKAVIGLSGGIDSALVAALAADALGSGNVTGIFMPSPFSSKASEDDARALASNLKIKLITIPIEEIFNSYLKALEPHFAGREKDIAEENLQARIRGNTLMAFSNKFGWLLLTTGNKSEMSAGYATLYGDMAGGLAVIKDVPKTTVYKLARYRNSPGEVIPGSCLTKEPTAELKANQKDSDTLPPYDVLDPIIKAYVEEDKPFNRIISMGFDKTTVGRVLRMVDNSEFKRRQSPPGIKITPRAFGRDRRMPITNKYAYR